MRLLDNGTYQLALVALSGWDKLEVLDTKGLNPVKPASAILNAAATLAPATGSAAPYATLMLWKKSGTAWTDAELLPVRKLTTAADGSVSVTFTDGSRKQVKYPE